MAKHAKRKKKKSSSRRRVGAMALNANSALVQYGSIAAGFFAAKTINENVIDKIADPTKVDQKLVAGAQVGAGAAYLFLKKGAKSLPLVVASGLLIGSGVKRAMTAFGLGALPINAYQNVPHLNGYQDVHHVGARKRIGQYNPSSSGMGYNAQRIPINGNKPMFANRMRA